MTKLAGLILAGGKSTRMGKDKMHLKYKNKAFIDHIIEALQECESIYVSISKDKKYTRSDVTLIEDELEAIGPMGGLYTALKFIEQAYIWVCGCDMPYLSKELIEYTLGYVEGEKYDAYLLRTADGRIHPLAGIYHKRVRKVLEKCIAQNNYRMMNLISQLQVKIIDLKYTYFESEGTLANINTPEAYAQMGSYPILGVSGIKNSGKTTVVTTLVEALSQKGLKVGTIKHDGHLFEADVKGTDSYRHKQAGAKQTLVFDAEKFCLVQEQEGAEVESFFHYFEDVDLLIIEGLKKSDYPKIEVVRKAVSTMPVCKEETVIGYVTDCTWETTKPCYALTDQEGWISLVENYIKGKEEQV